jgi:hypothetical protein
VVNGKARDSGIDAAALESIYSGMAQEPNHDLKGIVIVRDGHLVSEHYFNGDSDVTPKSFVPMTLYILSRRSTVKNDSSYFFQFSETARPAGLGPAAFWFEDMQYKTLSAAAGVAYRRTRHYLALELDRSRIEIPG